jgi:hypothetical protein
MALASFPELGRDDGPPPKTAADLGAYAETPSASTHGGVAKSTAGAALGWRNPRIGLLAAAALVLSFGIGVYVASGGGGTTPVPLPRPPAQAAPPPSVEPAAETAPVVPPPVAPPPEVPKTEDTAAATTAEPTKVPSSKGRTKPPPAKKSGLYGRE